MPHLLAKLKNVPLEKFRQILELDKEFHEENGLFIQHVWQNAEDANEIIFLFRITDIQQTKKLIDQLHTKAAACNPEVNLPVMTYLK